jgi:hypothetical protein
MFLLYHSDRCNTSETLFHWCYVSDLHTTHAVVCWVTIIPLSGRVPGRASGPSWSRVDNGGGLQYVSLKSVISPRVFTTKGIYRQKGDVRGWTRGPHHLVARLGGGPRHPIVWLPPGCSPSLLWTPSLCQVNRNFGFRFVQFREYFLCNFSETQKQQKIGTGTVASC